MTIAPQSVTAAADDPDALVSVVYRVRHYFAGESHPREPGDREQLPLHLARALRSYQIVTLEEDPDMRVIDVPAPAPVVPQAPQAGPFKYNAGGLLIMPDPRLLG
jgi:hypothetical protein